MRVLALDVSTSTGAAVVEVNNGRPTILWAGLLLPPKGLTGMRRAGAITQKVVDTCEEWKPEKVWIEGYAFSFKGSGTVLVEIGTIIRYFLYQEGYEYIEVSPTTLKKFATGNGAAQKDLMIKEVYKKWGYDTDSNDVADAVALGMFGLAAEGKLTLTKVQQETIDKFLAPPPPKKKSKKMGQ